MKYLLLTKPSQIQAAAVTVQGYVRTPVQVDVLDVAVVQAAAVQCVRNHVVVTVVEDVQVVLVVVVQVVRILVVADVLPA